LKRVVEIVNAMEAQPDFLVASGDLTNRGDTESYRLVKSTFEALEIPAILALGNHDERAGFHEVFGDGPSDAPYYHETTIAGLHVVTLDTSIPGRVSGRICDEQFGFLERVLEIAPDMPKTVKATVARITVNSRFDAAVTPTNQLISNRPRACKPIAPIGMSEALPSSTPTPSAQPLPKSGPYQAHPTRNDTTAPAITANQLTFAVISPIFPHSPGSSPGQFCCARSISDGIPRLVPENQQRSDAVVFLRAEIKRAEAEKAIYS